MKPTCLRPQEATEGALVERYARQVGKSQIAEGFDPASRSGSSEEQGELALDVALQGSLAAGWIRGNPFGLQQNK